MPWATDQRWLRQAAMARAGGDGVVVVAEDLTLRRPQQVTGLTALELRKGLLDALAHDAGLTGIRTFLSAFVATLRPTAPTAAATAAPVAAAAAPMEVA
jgi:hypothetical protein